MVSTRPLIAAAALTCILLPAPAQSPQSLLGSQPKPPVPVPAPPAPVQLDPEKRADILMARKMYSEAVEVYKQGPQDSAVVTNKIGIAYHQMLQIEPARRYYEK